MADTEMTDSDAVMRPPSASSTISVDSDDMEVEDEVVKNYNGVKDKKPRRKARRNPSFLYSLHPS